jgi:uncharacterized phage-associated protein
LSTTAPAGTEVSHPYGTLERMFECLRLRASRHNRRQRPTLTAVAVSAHDVAVVLRQRQAGLPIKKLHKLLYYCQGHHLAAFGEPLFSETISAWDMGPVVGALWYQETNGLEPPPRRQLTEAQLNTVGYVLSRYGALTGMDLERLTHSELPWQEADKRRQPGESARIEAEHLQAFFRSTGAPDDSDPSGLRLDADAVHEWLQDAAARRHQPKELDTLADLQARLSRSA